MSSDSCHSVEDALARRQHVSIAFGTWCFLLQASIAHTLRFMLPDSARRSAVICYNKY